jgi:hypothetical protein
MAGLVLVLVKRDIDALTSIPKKFASSIVFEIKYNNDLIQVGYKLEFFHRSDLYHRIWILKRAAPILCLSTEAFRNLLRSLSTS